jgi:hypothetical protein
MDRQARKALHPPRGNTGHEETILHILSKDVGEKPARKAKVAKTKMSKHSKKAPGIEENVEAWLASDRADAVAAYADRGRKHKDLSDSELADAWVASFREMANDYADLAARSRNGDFQAELELRKIEPPFGRVQEASKRYVARALEMFGKMKAEDPARFDQAAKRSAEDLERFEEKLKKPKH